MATDSRMDRLEVSVDGLRGELQSLRTDMNARFGDVNARINTLIGISIGLWITTIGTLVGLFLGAR